MPIEKVGVVGCGLMGSGIAQVAAQSGCDVIVREVSAPLVEKGLQSIEKNLARLVEKGTLQAADRDTVRARLRGTTNLEDFKDRDIIIEAIIEQLPAKRELYSALDKICPSKPSSPAILPRFRLRRWPHSPRGRTVSSACISSIPCR